MPRGHCAGQSETYCLLVSQGLVLVKAYPDKGARHITIKVIDQGTGIPRDKLLTIFEAFKQVGGVHSSWSSNQQ